jgi:glucose-1-phosphate thymidylyltransferase
MIYYPISVLMLAGIRDILIITTPQDRKLYERVLGSGARFGVTFTYAEQPRPEGLAQAFLIGEEFIGQSPVCLVLGDNIFHGQDFRPMLKKANERADGATVFAYGVRDPENFGVVEFDESARVVSLEEKPAKPKSRFAITGLYFYDNSVIEIAKSVKPSSRGEFEITSINQTYLERRALVVEVLGRGYAWLDTGTHQSLLQASHYVEAVESRQGHKIACLEEIGWQSGWLSSEDLIREGQLMGKTAYGEYLLSLAATTDH